MASIQPALLQYLRYPDATEIPPKPSRANSNPYACSSNLYAYPPLPYPEFVQYCPMGYPILAPCLPQMPQPAAYFTHMTAQPYFRPHQAPNLPRAGRSLCPKKIMETCFEKAQNDLQSTLFQKSPYLANLSIEDLNKKLLNAANDGAIDEVLSLLDKPGIDVNTQDENLQTPLHKATNNGYFEVMGVLLNAQANKYASDRNKKTPMSIAIAIGHLLPILTLLQGGYDANFQDEALERPLNYIIKRTITSSARHLSKKIAVHLRAYGASITLAASAIFLPSTEKLKDGSLKKLPNMTAIRIFTLAKFSKSEILEIIKKEHGVIFKAGEMDTCTSQKYQRAINKLIDLINKELSLCQKPT